MLTRFHLIYPNVQYNIMLSKLGLLVETSFLYDSENVKVDMPFGSRHLTKYEVRQNYAVMRPGSSPTQ